MGSYVQEFHVQDGVLLVHLSGTFPNERLAAEENLFKPLADECSRRNCVDAIVDARELQVDFDTVALFRAGLDAAALSEYGLHVALLARPDMISAFFDDVIYNRGARVHVCTDLQSAWNWIRQCARPRQAFTASR